jgi:hypothetical protein
MKKYSGLIMRAGTNIELFELNGSFYSSFWGTLAFHTVFDSQTDIKKPV